MCIILFFPTELIYSGYFLSVKMTTYSEIDKFTDSGNWSQYIDRVNYYFPANDITDWTNKINVLLAVCSSGICHQPNQTLNDMIKTNLLQEKELEKWEEEKKGSRGRYMKK